MQSEDAIVIDFEVAALGVVEQATSKADADREKPFSKCPMIRRWSILESKNDLISCLHMLRQPRPSSRKETLHLEECVASAVPQTSAAQEISRMQSVSSSRSHYRMKKNGDWMTNTIGKQMPGLWKQVKSLKLSVFTDIIGETIDTFCSVERAHPSWHVHRGHLATLINISTANQSH